MKNADSLGQFEQLVLTGVLLLREQAYGMAVHAKVCELGGRQVLLPAVYVTLDRLEDKGYVTSWLTDPTPERGGRAKRCFRLLALGERALQESASTSRRIVDAVEEGWSGRWKPRRAK